MVRTIDDFIAELPAERKEKVHKQYREMREQYLALQDLRKDLNLTQEQLAEILDMDQGNLSRLEKRSDLMVSTLRKYIKAMGGELRIVVEFPGQPEIELTGFSEE